MLVCCVISNIPASFHSSDLRSFFSRFTESKRFHCFHYKHRPEIRPSTDVINKESLLGDVDATARCTGIEKGDDGSCEDQRRSETCCCVIRLDESHLRELQSVYSGKHWVDRTGTYLRRKVKISRLRLIDDKNTEAEVSPSSEEIIFHLSDCERLPELNPPNLMPQGNVGTPTSHFLRLIQACRFPPRLIGHLGLVFNKSHCRRKYGAVPLDYSKLEMNYYEYEDSEQCDDDQTSGKLTERSSLLDSSDCRTAHGHLIRDELPRIELKASGVVDDEEDLKSQENGTGEDSDGDAEEWDRHEAFHDDVDSQGRTKERLYEEEIELKWEKGGSGLVFYTDAAYWDQFEGDFDEKTSDDWDVDMSVYYEPGAGDKDARDFVQMHHETRLREGKDVADWHGIGGFEKYTKGFGGRVMRSQGWEDGQGLGRQSRGIARPLEADGQLPRNKAGLGYQGMKLDRMQGKKRHRAEGGMVISTVYDQKDDPDSLLRLRGPAALKYRKIVNFKSGGTRTSGSQQ